MMDSRKGRKEGEGKKEEEEKRKRAGGGVREEGFPEVNHVRAEFIHWHQSLTMINRIIYNT